MNTRIFDATASDVEEIAELAARTFPLACPPGTDEADIRAAISAMLSPERFADYIADPDRVVRVAEKDGAFVGYAMFVTSPSQDSDVTAAIGTDPSVEVSKMYVAPESHGSGTAAALMESGSELAATLGRRSLWLGVNDQNARARRFYEKCGFAIAGPKTFMLGTEIQHDFVMLKRLD